MRWGLGGAILFYLFPLRVWNQVLLHTDSGAASSDDVVCVFGDVAVMNPRGRFEVELHLNFLSLVGQVRGRLSEIYNLLDTCSFE